MRILKITEDSIEFDNGKDISFEHDQDCCENNYADLSNSILWLVMLISATQSCLNHATMVSDSATRR